jgi:hypothetical protein
VLLIAEGKNYVTPEQEPRPAELDFSPGNAKRRVTDAKEKKNGQIEGVFRGCHADYAAVMPPEAHIYSVEKWTGAACLAIWI